MKKKVEVCFWKQCLVFVGLMTLLFCTHNIATKYIILQKDLKRFMTDDFTFVFQVDDVQLEENDFILNAWAFKLGEESTNGAMELLLYDLEEGTIVYPKKKEFRERLDVNKYFLCEFDYSNCGIVVSFNARKLALANKDYEILISDVKGKKIYQTGTYINNGELMYCLPEEYRPLDVAGTDLEKVVNDGILRAYRPDFGMYVYQYEGVLYWIAEPEYGFVDGNTYVQYQMNTTQPEKLPAESIINNWTWSNIGFYFKSNELTELNTGKYRVTRCALPLEYSITTVWTGNHIHEWIWKQSFRPWYEFSD